MSNTESIYTRIAKKRFTTCSVPGCYDFVNRVSRYCNRHKLAALKFGGPNRRAIRETELEPHRRIVRAFCRTNAKHAALQEVYGKLHGLLDNAATFTAPERLRVRDWQSRLMVELRRLHEGGTTGREVFVAIASVFLFAQRQPAVLSPSGRHYAFAVARAVLRLRKRSSHVSSGDGKSRVSNRTSTLVLSNLGDELVTTLSPLLRRMLEALPREDKPSPTRNYKPMPNPTALSSGVI